jgi:hypothetical protein
MLLCCQLARVRGASAEQMAGALATMMQESACINLKGGDGDSAGLYQQRPSVGVWGSYAQVTTPSHAINAFLTPYLNYCRKGMNVIAASDAVQRSALPNAPAVWLPEARKDVATLMGSKDFADATSTGADSVSSIAKIGGTGYNSQDKTLTITTTRVLPYDFSRGSAGKRETSWDCMGRLADEVQWNRFMRGGVLWFVSEDWLARQTPRFVFVEGARGVLSITHSFDARRSPAEATVSAVAQRWSVLPGDAVLVQGEGPGDGTWLVTEVVRDAFSPIATITLKRPVPPLKEPANETQSTTTTVGGGSAPSGRDPYSVLVARLHPSKIEGGAAAGPTLPQKIYEAAQYISDLKIPYSQRVRYLVTRPKSADCSSSVSLALLLAGVPLPGGVGAGKWAPVSGAFEGWGLPGRGRYVTIWCSAEHVWIQFTGVGPAWRFDTSPWGCGDPNGPRMRNCPRSTATFTARHWAGT